MRVALVMSQAFALVNFRSPLMKEMVAGGACVYALAPDYDDELRAQVRAVGAEPVDFRLSRAGTNPFSDLRGMIDLYTIFRRLRIDLVLTNFVKSVIYGTLAAWLARVPRRYALIAGLGYSFAPPEGETGTRRRILHRTVAGLYGLAVRRAHGVFFQNGEDRDLFVHRGLVAPQKAVRINGTGVDLNEWAVAPPVSEPLTFMLAARLLREKGVGDYVAAARLIKAEYPDVRYLLLGDTDPNPGSFQPAEVRAWVEQGIVEWPGHVPVKPYLQQTSVYCLPSYYREGVPRSIQEALALGRPVITTDSVGCRETVVPGENGLLVPPRDPAALADAMRHFVANPQLIAPWGQASRRLAEDRYDVTAINRIMLDTMGMGLP